ncbi:MAG TPA: XdhC family protein, partial [Tepidisphaeraceae bacterium]
MPSELEQLLALWNHRPPGAAVLATVVHVEGSAYRRPGSRMLAFENGPRVGTISGGCLERDLLSKAFFLTREGPTTIDYDTRDGDMGDYNLGCRGLVRVLLQPLEQNPRPIELLSRVMQNDEPITTVTNHGITGDRPDAAIGDQFVFDRTGETQDRYPLWLNHAMGEIVNVIDDGLPRACRITHEGGRVNVLIERIDPPQPVIVFGAG